MSHTTTYPQIIKDINLFCDTCDDLGHKVIRAAKGANITVNQYSKNWIKDAVASVHLSGWRFPIAIMPNGEIMYDHWGSKANTMELLGEALQTYNHKLVVANIDMTTVEQYYSTEKPNGDIVVTLEY